MRRAVHGELERQSGETLDLFGGVPGPLRDEFDHRGREVRVSIHRHLAKRPCARDHHEHSDHENQKTLAKREMYDAMDHRWVRKLLYCCNEFMNCKNRLPLPATRSPSLSPLLICTRPWFESPRATWRRANSFAAVRT